MKDNLYIKIKKSTCFVALVIALGIGYMSGSMIHVNSDDREVKFPDWQPIAMQKYKGYEFTHIDYLQPQFINTIIDEEMLELIETDIKAGLIDVANPGLGVEIGDGIKFTADDHKWYLMSAKDKTHKFKEIN